MAKDSIASATRPKKKTQKVAPAATPAGMATSVGKSYLPATAALANMPENPATLCLEVRGTWPPNFIAIAAKGGALSTGIPQPPASPAQVVMHIELTIDVSRFPFPVLYGTISGNIISQPTPGQVWRLTSSSLLDLDTTFVLDFELSNITIALRPVGAAPVGNQMTSISISGSPLYLLPEGNNAQPPYTTSHFSPVTATVYNGYYMRNDAPGFAYPCNILFKGWQPCT